MLTGLTRRISFIPQIFLFFGLLLSGCATAQTGQISSAPKIIAIGDMHGDYQAYESLMLASGLMDASGNWSGDNAIFVQTGDIPDRGPDTRKIIESLQKLEKQAPNSGGKVIPMVGNHEAMNMVGNLRYVHAGEFAAFEDDLSKRKQDEAYSQAELEFKEKHPDLSAQELRTRWDEDNPLGKVEHQHAWSPDGYIGDWVADNQVVTQVQGYLFAHGGFSQEFTTYSLDEMNAAGQKALLEQDWSKDSILRHNLGPLWYRGNVRGRKGENDFSRKDEISMVLETYDATHIIIGHTRNEDGIRVSSGGRLIQIDTGASAHYGGVPSYLRIENGEMFAHTLEGMTKIQ